MLATVAAAASSATTSGARSASAATPAASPSQPGIDHQLLYACEGGRHDKGCDQRGGEQTDGIPQWSRWNAPAREQRSAGLECQDAKTAIHITDGPRSERPQRDRETGTGQEW